MQQERTGRPPKAVTVVISDDVLVITLHEALSPAERLMSETAAEAAVEVEPVTGTFVHAFTSGDVVQIFQLTPDLLA